jgi:hypothetical protein
MRSPSLWTWSGGRVSTAVCHWSIGTNIIALTLSVYPSPSPSPVHVHKCASTTWGTCSCSASRTPCVARVRHSGLASLSLQPCTPGPRQPCTLGPGESSTISLGLAGGDTVICGAGAAELRSCLMENVSRKQAREECAHDDGGVGTRANLLVEVKGGRGGCMHVNAGRQDVSRRSQRS